MNKIPVDFEFEFSFAQPTADLTIEPMRGLIPKNSTIHIKFTFTPK